MTKFETVDSDMMYVLYFNGLGSGKTRRRERVAFDYLEKRGIQVQHVNIDWRSKETFEHLLARLVVLTKEELKEHRKIVLVGSSAGGSLTINIMSKLHDKRLFAVTLCSWLHEAKLPALDKRTLGRAAYIGTPKESRLFFDSVIYCGQTAIPKLTKSDKRRIITVQQWTDSVVPHQTMSVQGVKIFKVPGFGHAFGIAMGARRLPAIIKILTKSSVH
jgi:acetyl esterase/lipase